MAYIIQGKVLHRMEKRTGTSQAGKSWSSIDFVVQYDFDTQYPKKAVINFFGDEKVDQAINELRKDVIANFHLDIDAREFNGKWFNTIRCFKYEFPNANPQPQSSPVVYPDPQPAPQQYAQFDENDADKLPF